jgi:hypothetical protein
MGRLHCVNGLKLAVLFRAGPATWAGGPSQRRHGRDARPTAALVVARSASACLRGVGE